MTIFTYFLFYFRKKEFFGVRKVNAGMINLLCSLLEKKEAINGRKKPTLS